MTVSHPEKLRHVDIRLKVAWFLAIIKNDVLDREAGTCNV